LVEGQTLGTEKAELKHLGLLVGIDDGMADMEDAAVI